MREQALGPSLTKRWDGRKEKEQERKREKNREFKREKLHLLSKFPDELTSVFRQSKRKIHPQGKGFV